MKPILCSLVFLIMFFGATQIQASEPIDLWFAPSWKLKASEARTIAVSLSEKSGLNIKPRISNSYPEILDAFNTDKPNLVYARSFVHVILKARGLGEGMVQMVNGEELYMGVLIYPKDQDPVSIIEQSPQEIAYAVGSSAGESSAKAATAGAANFPTKSHTAIAGAVKVGKAKAGVVKNWWWEKNSDKFPELTMYEIPGVSILKNPDNVLCASKAVSKEERSKIINGAKLSKEAFHAKEVVTFDPSAAEFSLSLMKKGKIDPLSYRW